MRKEVKLGDILDYEQPNLYIVRSSNYDKKFVTPVLTAGQSFILGYTNEKENIFKAKENPVIIFDDFTTASKYVDFDFKVKSSAMKILKPKEGINIKYVYYAMQNIKFDNQLHKRYWISEYSKIKLLIPDIKIQEKIVKELDLINKLINYKREQEELLDYFIKSQFVEMFGNKDFKKEKLKNNIIEMFIGPFGSALKNEYFVDKENGYSVVYEQKHAINKNIKEFRWVDENKYKSLERFNVKPGDIIVSCRGTVGKTYIIPDDAPIGIMHPSIMKIRLKKEKYIPKFFEKVLEEYLEDKERETMGAIIKMGIKASQLEKEYFIIPDLSVQTKYLNIVKQIDKQKFESMIQLKMMEKIYNIINDRRRYV